MCEIIWKFVPLAASTFNMTSIIITTSARSWVITSTVIAPSTSTWPRLVFSVVMVMWWGIVIAIVSVSWRSTSVTDVVMVRRWGDASWSRPSIRGWRFSGWSALVDRFHDGRLVEENDPRLRVTRVPRVLEVPEVDVSHALVRFENDPNAGKQKFLFSKKNDTSM